MISKAISVRLKHHWILREPVYRVLLEGQLCPGIPPPQHTYEVASLGGCACSCSSSLLLHLNIESACSNSFPFPSPSPSSLHIIAIGLIHFGMHINY